MIRRYLKNRKILKEVQRLLVWFDQAFSEYSFLRKSCNMFTLLIVLRQEKDYRSMELQIKVIHYWLYKEHKFLYEDELAYALKKDWIWDE